MGLGGGRLPTVLDGSPAPSTPKPKPSPPSGGRKDGGLLAAIAGFKFKAGACVRACVRSYVRSCVLLISIGR